MGWPKGKLRGSRKRVEVLPDVGEPRPTRGASAPKSKKWTMKAGSNWDTASEVDDNPDRYHIPQELFPEGMDLQWITQTVAGQEMPQLVNAYFRAGWTPIHVEDFDGRFNQLFPGDGAGYINLDGQILCARPLEMSIAAKKRDQQRAKEQISLKEQAFRGGDLPISGVDHPSARAVNRISRTMERIEIPKD